MCNFNISDEREELSDNESETDSLVRRRSGRRHGGSGRDLDSDPERLGVGMGRKTEREDGLGWFSFKKMFTNRLDQRREYEPPGPEG